MGAKQGNAGYVSITYGKSASLGSPPAASKLMVLYLCSFSGCTSFF